VVDIFSGLGSSVDGFTVLRMRRRSSKYRRFQQGRSEEVDIDFPQDNCFS
jgi:hypothetical protein